jgi:hypothetical protein
MIEICLCRIIDFDYLIAKDNQCYSGEPYKSIQAIGRKAKWTAVALFKLNREGKITLYIVQ